MSSFSKCKQQGLSCSEHDASFEVINKSGADVQKFKVEDCIITEGRKCDFLFEVQYPTRQKNLAIYVELKQGWSFEDALEQLQGTACHEEFKDRHRDMKRLGIIAGKMPCPAFDSTSTDTVHEFARHTLRFPVQLRNSYEV